MAQQQSKTEPDSTGDVSAAPGEILVKAREAAHLSRARVATELGLTETAVREIEENHFEKFAAGIYVRGYLRNYCKLLALNENQLLEKYDQYCLDQGMVDKPAQRQGRAMSAEDRRRLLLGIVIGLIAVACVFILIWLANL